MNSITYVGLDVHVATVAVAEGGRGVTISRQEMADCLASGFGAGAKAARPG
jgi:hypothetical protein